MSKGAHNMDRCFSVKDAENRFHWSYADVSFVDNWFINVGLDGC
jgi:hypothetical protein